MLTGPTAPSPEAVAARLLAIQAQDLRAALLAIRARTSGLHRSDIDAALTDDRSLIVSWLNRGTLHLVRAEDYPWLHALTTPQLTSSNARRLEQEGVSPDDAERAVTTIVSALSHHGPLTRGDLRTHVDALGVRTAGQALVHILFLATIRGLIVRGPIVAKEQAFVLTHDWFGPTPSVDRDVALAELARRFLVGHGPATDRDLAKWAGLGLGEVRTGFRAIGGDLVEHGDGTVDLARLSAQRRHEVPPPRLLGAFDPILHGWVDRTPIIGAHTGIVTSNGVFRPFILAEGRAVGLWTRPRGMIALAPFDSLAPDVQAELDQDADDIARFLN